MSGRTYEKEIAAAWYAKSSDREEILLLEVRDRDLTNPIWKQLASWGERWTELNWICAVASPDKARVKKLENRMREKFGWDPRR